jgi:hypothetical protein
MGIPQRCDSQHRCPRRRSDRPDQEGAQANERKDLRRSHGRRTSPGRDEGRTGCVADVADFSEIPIAGFASSTLNCLLAAPQLPASSLHLLENETTFVDNETTSAL